jgi:hypothetical protein
VTARLPETYQWLLVPGQENPQGPVNWHAMRLGGQDALAVRASKKLRSDELLVTAFAPTRLKMELDRVPLWRGDHVSVMAEWTGLEPATPGVTGRYSNQLNYHSRSLVGAAGIEPATLAL